MTTMSLLPKIIFFLTLIKIVTPQNYLFESAHISFKTDKGQVVRNQLLTKKLATIDHHNFVQVTDFKIKTKKMKMYKGAVKNLPELRVLRLKECGIEELAPSCLQNLPKLEVLHLQDNDLTIIEEGVFNDLPIRELWLNKNEIETILPGAFDNMPNLEIIQLNSNSLTQWNSRWFSNTPKLWQLFFRRNAIERLPPRAFANIQTSHKKDGVELVDTKIFLSKNGMSYIDPEAFHGIDSLDELDLGRNLLENIDWSVFSNLKVLNKLGLSKNSLKNVDDDAFDNIPEILELDLSKNHLECVSYKIVAKVKKINLSRNDMNKCDCLTNLVDKLSEEEISNEVVATDMDCDLNWIGHVEKTSEK